MAAAGGLRADFVKGPHTPHSTFLSRCSILECGFRHITVDNQVGASGMRWGVRVGWSVVSGVYTGMGDWARQIGADKRQSVTDFRKFLRSQTGHIIAVYRCHA